MSSQGTDRSGVAGQWSPSDGATPFNATAFQITQALGLLNFCKLVQVQACTNTDTIDPVGTVDVMQLVNLLDGQGNSSPPGPIYKLPYFRMQGGKSAFINDPQKGDIGLAVFADRDISAVKRTKKQANPGSGRRFALADGLYFGGFLNAAPTQYFQFMIDGNGNPIGIKVLDANGNTILMSNTGMTIQDMNNNMIVMDSAGIHINGILIDRSQNVSAIQKLTTIDLASLGGGSQFMKLADGTNSTKVKGT